MAIGRKTQAAIRARQACVCVCMGQIGNGPGQSNMFLAVVALVPEGQSACVVSWEPLFAQAVLAAQVPVRCGGVG